MSDQLLKENYYNPNIGLISAKKLYKKLKPEYPELKLKHLTKLLKNQETYQVFQPIPKLKYYPVIAHLPFERIQIDLMDMKNEPNRTYKWIMNAVDVYTRYAISIPLKNKTQTEATRGLKQILFIITNELNQTAPLLIDSDYESAFQSSDYRRVLKKYEIENNYTKSKHTLGIVERYNQTLRNLIERYKFSHNTNNWIDVLQNLVYNYNHTLNTGLNIVPLNSIKNNPNYNRNINKQIKKAEQQEYNKNDLKVGDQVRLEIKKATFEKGSTKRYTQEIHTIEELDGYNDKPPFDYYVNDRVNPYLRNELLKVTKSETYNPSEQPEQFEIPTARERTIARRLAKEGI
jgi:transposase InsO family protein